MRGIPGKNIARILLVFMTLAMTVQAALSQEILEAAREGDLDAVKALVDADPEEVNTADDRSCTALHFAADGGHDQVISFLLAAGADLEARDADGDTPLHWAACRENVAVIELLIAKGAQLNAVNLNNDTPLHYAALRDKLPAADALLRASADTEISDAYGRTPLLLVARETGQPDMARLLLDHGANVNVADRFDDTPLGLAAWRGFSNLVNLFLDRGAEVPLSGDKCEEYLQYAARRSQDRLFEAFVEGGAGLDFTTDTGGTLLHSAGFGGSPRIIETLADRGFELDQTDSYGWTALHHAASRGRQDGTALLLDRGADPAPRTLAGYTPHNLAGKEGHDDTAALLAGEGGDLGPQIFPRFEGEYPDQIRPGHSPRLFAKDIVATNLFQHGSAAFSPDGQELFWSGTISMPDSGYSRSGIFTMKKESGYWTPPRMPSFVTGEFGGDVPFFHPNGQRLYFLSRRPLEPGGQSRDENMWMVDRQGDDWGEPRPVGDTVNGMSLHWQFSVDTDGAIYFNSRGGVFRAQPQGNTYGDPEPLLTSDGTQLQGAQPHIGPGGDFILLSVDTGEQYQLAISYAESGGRWTAPRVISREINYEGRVLCPILSPDGKYLFFLGATGEGRGVCWVEAPDLTSLRQNDPAPTPGTVLWKHQAGGEMWGPLTHDEGVLYFGCDNGKVSAFDIDSRSVRWEFQSGGKVRSAVLCAGGRAVFASDDGTLFALELPTGKEVWRFDLGSADMERILPATTPPYEYDYLHSSPIVVHGTVYVGSMDGHLYAVDHETGKERWKFPTLGKIRSTPVVDDGTVYFGSWDGHLYAVDAANGELRWRFDTGGIIQSSAAVAGGMVVVGSRSAKIFALDAGTGTMAWEHVHKDGSWVESTPVIHEGVVYIGSSDALELFAFDLDAGGELWTFKTNGWSWSTPLVTDDVVYIGGISAFPYYFEGVTLEAGLHAVDRETGKSLWSMAPEPIEGYITGGVFSLPVLVDRVLFVAGLDGYIYALQD